MSSFVLKVKSKSSQHVLRDLKSTTTVKELKLLLSTLLNIPTNRLQILYSYPPKPLTVSDEDLELSKTDLSTGDIIIIEERENVAPLEPSKNENVTQNQSESKQKSQALPAKPLSDTDTPGKDKGDDFPGILLKKIVPADNSCLFSSVNHVINGNIDKEKVAWLREFVAETVLTNAEKYSEAILGKPNAEYAKWIQNEASWGGAIELSIFADYFGVEIAVANTIDGIINIFGEDQRYSHRVFLLFDGVHYDPLYVEYFEDGRTQTIFPSDDERLLSKAKQLIEEAKSSRQFTDVQKFRVKCATCNIIISGQAMAQQHASSTGHVEFGEVL